MFEKHAICFTLFILSFILLQIPAALLDTWCTRRQVRGLHNRKRGALLEHGGFWIDLIMIVWIVAYVHARYALPLFSWRGMFSFAIMVPCLVFLGKMYSHNGISSPEAYTHDGRTTLAGWLHGMFAGVSLWTLLMFFIFMPTSPLFRRDIVWISACLTWFFYVGIRKFSIGWSFESTDVMEKVQTFAGPIVVWGIAFVRLIL